jgi:hypothetical protein
MADSLNPKKVVSTALVKFGTNTFKKTVGTSAKDLAKKLTKTQVLKQLTVKSAKSLLKLGAIYGASSGFNALNRITDGVAGGVANSPIGQGARLAGRGAMAGGGAFFNRGGSGSGSGGVMSSVSSRQVENIGSATNVTGLKGIKTSKIINSTGDVSQLMVRLSSQMAMGVNNQNDLMNQIGIKVASSNRIQSKQTSVLLSRIRSSTLNLTNQNEGIMTNINHSMFKTQNRLKNHIDEQTDLLWTRLKGGLGGVANGSSKQGGMLSSILTGMGALGIFLTNYFSDDEKAKEEEEKEKDPTKTKVSDAIKRGENASALYSLLGLLPKSVRNFDISGYIKNAVLGTTGRVASTLGTESIIANSTKFNPARALNSGPTVVKPTTVKPTIVKPTIVKPTTVSLAKYTNPNISPNMKPPLQYTGGGGGTGNSTFAWTKGGALGNGSTYSGSSLRNQAITKFNGNSSEIMRLSRQGTIPTRAPSVTKEIIGKATVTEMRAAENLMSRIGDHRKATSKKVMESWSNVKAEAKLKVKSLKINSFGALKNVWSSFWSKGNFAGMTTSVLAGVVIEYVLQNHFTPEEREKVPMPVLDALIFIIGNPRFVMNPYGLVLVAFYMAGAFLDHWIQGKEMYRDIKRETNYKSLRKQETQFAMEKAGLNKDQVFNVNKVGKTFTHGNDNVVGGAGSALSQTSRKGREFSYWQSFQSMIGVDPGDQQEVIRKYLSLDGKKAQKMVLYQFTTPETFYFNEITNTPEKDRPKRVKQLFEVLKASIREQISNDVSDKILAAWNEWFVWRNIMGNVSDAKWGDGQLGIRGRQASSATINSLNSKEINEKASKVIMGERRISDIIHKNDSYKGGFKDLEELQASLSVTGNLYKQDKDISELLVSDTTNADFAIKFREGKFDSVNDKEYKLGLDKAIIGKIGKMPDTGFFGGTGAQDKWKIKRDYLLQLANSIYPKIMNASRNPDAMKQLSQSKKQNTSLSMLNPLPLLEYSSYNPQNNASGTNLQDSIQIQMDDMKKTVDTLPSVILETSALIVKSNNKTAEDSTLAIANMIPTTPIITDDINTDKGKHFEDLVNK